MFALGIAIAALWMLAGVLWIADSPSPRYTIDTILASVDETTVATDYRRVA